MIRTQIYLTAQENQILSMLVRLEGRTKSEIIRKILDERLSPGSPRIAAAAAKKALGAWKSRGAKDQLRRLRDHW